MKLPWFVLACVVLLTPAALFGQIDCQVTVNMDKVSGSSTDQLQTFASDIQNYVNSTKWTREDLGDYHIKCTISIFFTAVNDDNTYSAQIFVGSQRPIYVGDNPGERYSAMLRLFDDKWGFTYLKNQPLYHDETRFDDLLSLIDFYMNLVMGYDFDSYKSLGGTPYFQRALSICNLAPSSSAGWDRSASGYSRPTFVEELLSAKCQTFRQGMHSYHFSGLDLLATKPAEAYQSIITFLKNASDYRKNINPRSYVVKSFFDTKYQELAQIFQNYQDKSPYQLLESVDPAHQLTYDEWMKK